MRKVCPKGAQRRSERKTLSWQQRDGRADQFRSRSSWCFGDLRWKLDLLLWPRDQETEFPVEACWLSQNQEGQTEQIHPQTFDNPIFLTALAWSTCFGFPLDRQSTRNTMLRFLGSSGRDSVRRGQHSSNQVSGISTRTMHQSTTASLSQTIWPIVQTLLPVTFGYSLSSKKNLEAVIKRQLKRWKRMWWRSLTHSHKRTSLGLPEIVGTVQQVYCSRWRLLRRGLEFHVCTINKSAHTKKSGNLLCAPCISKRIKTIILSAYL